MKIKAVRYHDFCAAHRVYGHENKCAHLHGHNYRIHFHVEADNLDKIGRVVDFSVIKKTLCNWLEKYWDHKFLIWEKDPLGKSLKKLDPEGVVFTPFNPTAENMAQYLMEKGIDGPYTLSKVIVEETRKCSAEVSLDYKE